MGRFVVDFVCERAHLIVEIDGGQHNDRRHQDVERTSWLNAQGYAVLRFWNNDLSENLDGLLETIYAALYGLRDAEPMPLKHQRRVKDHPAPLAFGKRPSPSRGG